MADVASALRSWSVTAGSNSPTTATVVGAGLAPNLQQIQATVRQYLASIGTSVVCSATTDLSTVDGYTIPLSGNSTVTSFGTEAAGISYRLQFSGTPLLKNSTAIQCPVSADLQIAANDIITVTSQGSGNWKVMPDLTATGKFSSIDSGTTGFLGLKTNNGSIGLIVSDNGTPLVNRFNFQGSSTGSAVRQIADGSDTNIATAFSTKGNGSAQFYTSSFTHEQLRLIDNNGANVVTITNGTNPTISTTAGSLTLGSAGTANIIMNTSVVGIGGASPSANGAGITFPATQSASTDVNTLDDYEEGTWVPSLGGNTTYTTQTGTYTKIGRLVFITGAISVNTIGTGSTSVVSGLPFTSNSANSDNYIGIPTTATLAVSVVSLCGRNSANTSSITIVGRTAAAATEGAVAVFQNGTQLNFSGVYQTT